MSTGSTGCTTLEGIRQRGRPGGMLSRMTWKFRTQSLGINGEGELTGQPANQGPCGKFPLHIPRPIAGYDMNPLVFITCFLQMTDDTFSFSIFFWFFFTVPRPAGVFCRADTSLNLREILSRQRMSWPMICGYMVGLVSAARFLHQRDILYLLWTGLHSTAFSFHTGYIQDRPARSVSFGYSQDNANQ